MMSKEESSKVIPVNLDFPDEEIKALPLFYVNAISVQAGMDDLFIVIGSVMPPKSPEQMILPHQPKSMGYRQPSAEIKSSENPMLTAIPLVRFAASPLVIKRLIDKLQAALVAIDGRTEE